MYCISEAQIDFILDDIRARGIGMVSLQQDLLDHICCVIEQDLEEGGNFESFYWSIIPKFYKTELKEIEEETVHLLTNKNYYIMKKVMIGSGTFSAGLLSLGILFKIMHWPGAAMILFLGIVTLSFIFLPLLFALRIKEKEKASEKAIIGVGMLVAILISMGILFKMMQWPFANILLSLALGIMVFIFIPVYFFSGIKNPVTKVNTIVSTILMVSGCALVFTLVRMPFATRKLYVDNTAYFFRNEQLVKSQQRQVSFLVEGKRETYAQSDSIYRTCETLKAFLLEKETGYTVLDSDFADKQALIGDTYVDNYLAGDANTSGLITSLHQQLKSYNQRHIGHENFLPISLGMSLFEKPGRIREVLNELTQIQMIVLQNQRGLIAMK